MMARLARSLRVRDAARRGIRAVPADPDTLEFPVIPFACDERPRRCGWCTADCCPYEVDRDALDAGEGR
jgi:hypothetical protein